MSLRSIVLIRRATTDMRSSNCSRHLCKHILPSTFLLFVQHFVAIDSTPMPTSRPEIMSRWVLHYSVTIDANILMHRLFAPLQYPVVIDYTFIRNFAIVSVFRPNTSVSDDSTPVPTFGRHRFYSRPNILSLRF